MRNLALVVSLLVPLLTFAGVANAGSEPTMGVRAADGASVVSETWVDARMVDLTITSPALGTTAMVRLIVPAGWSRTASRTWPAVWLLHGGVGDHTTWSSNTDLEQLTTGHDVILVMPDGGPCGWYSNWYNGGAYGSPAWETFHLTELRQILRAGYRAGRAASIAGYSMGGFGAMSYAARHPRMFKAAASFSGMVDSLIDDRRPTGPQLLYQTAAGGCPGLNMDDLWGDPAGHRAIWRSHNPTDQAAGLAGTKVFIAAGNGVPGPLDPPSTTPDPLIEPGALAQSQHLLKALNHADVPATTDFYGNGTHSWPYWVRELDRAFPMILAAIGAGRSG